METITFFMSMLTPMPKIVVGQTYTPPPPPARDVPFNWTPIVVVGLVALIGVAMMKNNKK